MNLNLMNEFIDCENDFGVGIYRKMDASFLFNPPIRIVWKTAGLRYYYGILLNFENSFISNQWASEQKCHIKRMQS